MTETAITPTERLLNAHLAGAPYRVGTRDGLWELHSLEFPYAVFKVTAARRPNAPGYYALRFDLTGYDDAPTACPWDIESDMPLASAAWPTGGELTHVFNPSWNPGALYMPMDRVALNGHDAWLSAPKRYLWQVGGEGVVQYLRYVSNLLNSDDYSGARGG